MLELENHGAVGNQYFRYDVRQASGITTAGQFIIRFIENKMNEYLNKKVLQTQGQIDYIVASDTDSIYVCLDKLVEKTCKDKTKEQKIDFLDKVVDSRLEHILQNVLKN